MLEKHKLSENSQVSVGLLHVCIWRFCPEWFIYTLEEELYHLYIDVSK